MVENGHTLSFVRICASDFQGFPQAFSIKPRGCAAKTLAANSVCYFGFVFVLTFAPRMAYIKARIIKYFTTKDLPL